RSSTPTSTTSRSRFGIRTSSTTARQQLPVARRRAAHADEPRAGPEAVRHARDHGHAGLRLERCDDLERPESAARYEQRIRIGRRRAHARTELDQVVLRDLVDVRHRLDAETLDDERLEAVLDQERM